MTEPGEVSAWFSGCKTLLSRPLPLEAHLTPHSYLPKPQRCQSRIPTPTTIAHHITSTGIFVLTAPVKVSVCVPGWRVLLSRSQAPQKHCVPHTDASKSETWQLSPNTCNNAPTASVTTKASLLSTQEGTTTRVFPPPYLEEPHQ